MPAPEQLAASQRHASSGEGSPAERLPARAVIFDLDGLLVDTMPIWRTIGNDVFASIGADVSALAASGVMAGMGVRDAVAMLRDHVGETVPAADDLIERVVAGVVDAVWQHARLKPGAVGALDLCAGHGLVAALASGSARPVIDAVLERFDLASRFSAICTSADDPYGKPHPAVFLRAAEQVGVEASRCVVVEDALLGCVAAKAASMRVIAVPEKEAAHDPRLAIADLILGSLEEFAAPPTLGVLGLR